MPENGYDDDVTPFSGAGEEPGLQIWRVEDTDPVLLDVADHGKFHIADSYIILQTKEVEGVGCLSWNIHFWSGKKATKEQGLVAAALCGFLDDQLDGIAVQYREAQEHESSLMLSYFKSGITYLLGGSSLRVKHPTPDPTGKKLFRCRGKHTVRVEQMEVKCGSLNQTDVFILDDGPRIFTWMGPRSATVERLKSLQITEDMRQAKEGGAHVTIVKEDWNSNTKFFSILGSKDRIIRTTDTFDDSDQVRKPNQDVVLYRVFEKDDGRLGAEVYKEKPLSTNMLNTEECYILDSGYTGVYAWTGKACPDIIRRKLWSTVNDFINRRGYPFWVCVVRCVEDGETTMFKQYFYDWYDGSTSNKRSGRRTATDERTESDDSDSEDEGESYDLVTAAEVIPGKLIPKIEDYMPDDGSGECEVFHLKANKLVPLKPKKHGKFFGGDCYVIKYTSSTVKIIYLWQGPRAKTDERAASARHAAKMNAEIGFTALQIRVVTRKEPKHFVKLFGGKIVVFAHGHAEGYRNIYERDGYDRRDPSLYHVIENDGTAKAIQVVPRGASLNENETFVLDYNQKAYVWVGQNALEHEVEMAKSMCTLLSDPGTDPAILQEGHESAAFWEALNGREPHYTGPKIRRHCRTPTRLFHGSNSYGHFRIEEVSDYTQQDLDEDDVMLLDTYDELFVWIGKRSNEAERKEVMATSFNYLNTDPSSRSDENTLIIVIHQDYEPQEFTEHFPSWDRQLWKNATTVDQAIVSIRSMNREVSLVEGEEEEIVTYALEELQHHTPKGVDPFKKEQYLSEADFEEVFDMTRDKFDVLPKWKQNDLKKKNKLF